MYASAFRLDGGSRSELEHRCLPAEDGKRTHGELYLVLVALHVDEGICRIGKPQFQQWSGMDISLFDVAFGIEGLILEA